ncbi:patatin-like phospholipase family protein, partial [bacterium]|nr:patatin-like phospholipase family protein [bacterium]
MSHKPVPFAEVLAHELRVVRKRRAGLWAVNRAAPGAPPPGAPDPEPTDAERQLPNPDDGLERLRKAALDEGLAGLALSGGGIRSGTFALGFLQGLARLRLLRAFDYVSTVSGGGYTGAWLAAWVYREGLGAAERQADPRRALANVETQLNPDRVRQADATRAVVVGAGTTAERPHQLLRDPAGAAPAVRPVVLDDEPEPVYHLRAYSNYLTPRPGLFSADTWTLFAIYARNTLVNLLILVPAVLVVVLAAQLAVWGCARGGAGVGEWAVAGAFLAAALLGLVTIGRDQLALQQARQAPAAARAAGRGAETSVGRFVWLIVVPCVVTAALGAWLLTVDPDDPTGGRLRHPAFDLVNGGAGAEAVPVWVKYVVGFAALGAVAGLAGAAVRWLTGRGRVWVAFASPVVLGVGVGALSYPALRYALWELTGCPAALTAVGPPLFLLAFAVAGFLESALLSRALSEYEREWRSRLAGNLVIAAGAWLVFFGTIFFLPPAVVWLAGQTRLGEAGTWVAVGGWVATTLAGLLAAKSPRTGGDAGRAASPVLEVVAGVGPIVFLVGLLGVLGALSTLLVGGHTDGTRLYVPGEPPAGLAALLWIVGGAAGCAVVSVGLSAATDANVFSLHALYANRLVRCYLGASRRKAQASDEREYGRLRPPAGPTGPGAQVWEWGPGTGGAPTGAGQGVRREN